MRKIAMEDLLGLSAYEKARDRYRREIIDYKRSRRLPVGDRVSLLFENRCVTTVSTIGPRTTTSTLLSSRGSEVAWGAPLLDGYIPITRAVPLARAGKATQATRARAASRRTMP